MTLRPVSESATASAPVGRPEGVAWERLEEQLTWYSAKSDAAQHAYKGLKLVQIIVGAAVPVVALAATAKIATAVLAAIVVVLEGVQQLYQWQTNWVLYRSTAEALKHERFLFLAGAGPYGTADRHAVLAERVEGLVSQEHARWMQVRESGKADTTAATGAQ